MTSCTSLRSGGVRSLLLVKQTRLWLLSTLISLSFSCQLNVHLLFSANLRNPFSFNFEVTTDPEETWTWKVHCFFHPEIIFNSWHLTKSLLFLSDSQMVKCIRIWSIWYFRWNCKKVSSWKLKWRRETRHNNLCQSGTATSAYFVY